MTGFLEKLQNRFSTLGGSLCIGLDPDLEKLPQGFSRDAHGVEKFLEAIVDSTQDFAAAYKPNLAFFEGLGSQGLQVFETLRARIPETIPVILDAKRGDIDSSSRHYAKALFERWQADAVTVSPYMGWDSLEPFLAYAEKCVFILGLTSNPGRHDVQLLKLADGRYVFQSVMQTFRAKPCQAQRGWVIGATLGDLTQAAFDATGDDPVLVPGVGAQGGDLQTVFSGARGKRPEHIVINAGRTILYAAHGSDFAEQARAAAEKQLREICTALTNTQTKTRPVQH